MPLTERNALQCKAQLARLGKMLSRGGGELKKHDVVFDFLGPTKCPVAGESTCAPSLEASVGKPRKELVLKCVGHYHAEVGWPEDYPRWEDGKIWENPEGTVALPSGLALPLPVDAQILETTAGQGTVKLVFSTEENLEELATRYNKKLNSNADLVLAPHRGRQSVGGKLNYIQYSVSLDSESRQVTVKWDPILDPNS